MKDLIDTTEMYLRTIYELREEGVRPLRARIAERLNHSGPTVSQTVARMERDGLLTLRDDRHIELSETGEHLATQVMRKHRLAERLLTDVIGLQWELVHDEACRWEHVISVEVEQRLVEILDGPRRSPYGNPIPGLDELGAAVDEAQVADVSLAEAISGAKGPIGVRCEWISEVLQGDVDGLSVLRDAGIEPGTKFVARPGGLGVILEVADGRSCEIHTDTAKQLFVTR